MRLEIRKLHNQQNATTIYVTHDQIEAMTMADEIVIMNGGIIEQMHHPMISMKNLIIYLLQILLVLLQ